MEIHNGHAMTLANSIIGVSVLAMPFCFKQCGIILSLVILLISSIISRLACHYLLKSAIIARRKTFEYLAFYIFGGLGKFIIEVGIIGFLIGTCIAFFVVIGDLGPEIVAQVTGSHVSNTMRTSIMMALALFCVLPLGLLRNVDSLNGVSKATIGFYCCLVLKIVAEAVPHILSGDWYNHVDFWRPAGVLQCLPIFSMALSCQTQLFEIFQVLHNPTLENMNNLVRIAVNICTLLYIFVGIFGYIAFSQKPITGNVLLTFSPSVMTDVMKIGFVLSLVFSFPLVIFPCRVSLYSLLYKEGYSVHEGLSNYIPEGRFKGLTMFIVFISLIIGIMIPNIEMVLGLVGSTIGIMICILFPVMCFIYISQRNTNERLLAQVIVVFGLFVMVLGTYVNWNNLDSLDSKAVVLDNAVTQKIDKVIDKVDINIEKVIATFSAKVIKPTTSVMKLGNKIIERDTSEDPLAKVTEGSEIRHEPPHPVEPQEEVVPKNKPKLVTLNVEHNEMPAIKIESIEKPIEAEKVEKKVDTEKAKLSESAASIQKNKTSKNDEVDVEAIKKDDKETELQEHENDHQILIDTIQKQNEVQKEIVEQQKQLLEVIKKQQKDVEKKEEIDKVNEEKLKAVKEIESVARKAIERLSAGNEKENIVADLEKNIKEKVENKNPKGVESLNKLKKIDQIQNKSQNMEDINESKVSVKQAEHQGGNNLKVAHDENKKKKAAENKVKTVEIESKKNDLKLALDETKKIENAAVNEIKNIVEKESQKIIKERKKEIDFIEKNVNQDITLDKSIPIVNKNANNTAPLFVNLGQKNKNSNEKKETKENKVLNMVPIPIAMSNNIKLNDTNIKKLLENRVIIKNITSQNRSENVEKSKRKIQEDVNKNLLNNSEELKVIRRDILSYLATVKR